VIGVSARKELGCDEETDTGCGSSGLALPGVQARNAAEVACRRPRPVRSLVRDAKSAPARLAIAAEVRCGTEGDLTATRILLYRKVQRRHNNGDWVVADFLVYACCMPVASLAGQAGSFRAAGEKRFDQKQGMAIHGATGRAESASSGDLPDYE
jgi:hypothetical protein